MTGAQTGSAGDQSGGKRSFTSRQDRPFPSARVEDGTRGTARDQDAHATSLRRYAGPGAGRTAAAWWLGGQQALQTGDGAAGG